MAWARTRDGRQTVVPVVTDTLASVDDSSGTSPVSVAAQARMRGDRFFQVEIDHATLTRHADSASQRPRRSNGATDLLGQIEELGWSLEHVAWWPAQGASGTVGMRGVYLFRASGEMDVETAAEVETSRACPAPSHRRDVASAAGA